MVPNINGWSLYGCWSGIFAYQAVDCLPANFLFVMSSSVNSSLSLHSHSLHGQNLDQLGTGKLAKHN